LVALGTDQADLSGPDAVVDAVRLTDLALRRGYGCSLLCNGCCLPVRPVLMVLDAKPAERTGRDRRVLPGAVAAVPLDLDAPFDRCDDRGGQVGVAPTSR
jgi:hypothetical protein